jgi:hypothetical protein
MEHKQNKTDWKSLVQGFVGDILERIGDNVSKKVHTFITQLKKRTIGAMLMATGVLFILIGAVMFINTVLVNEFPWIGWGLVGLVVLLAGYMISKD